MKNFSACPDFCRKQLSRLLQVSINIFFDFVLFLPQNKGYYLSQKVPNNGKNGLKRS